jgi:3'-phosphoadenosine 5'-phosphosulfate sulfotransferase (PAPS reductase)/FAD synthetase
MQIEMFIEYKDYSNDEVLIGLSGGINSQAVLCWLANYPEEFKPKVLHIFYAHFAEHSPDTFQFVADGIRYARKHFKQVRVKITRNSVLKFFKEQKMIPHPMSAPCTRLLKIVPMMEYAVANNIKIDLVGYVREEARRMKNMAKKVGSDIVDAMVQAGNIHKHFPIGSKSNEWCFEIVDREIGWHPAIYDIRDSKGNRVFTHNNCLPCKNMQKDDFEEVKTYYPEYWDGAMKLSEDLQLYWGRDAQEFYTTFGRHDFETGYQKQSCAVCAED